jgi:3-oxoacyl-[acyl-carrier-protein] synthase-3
MSAGATILGFGHAVPDRRVANAELEARLGLEPGWIERRTGIAERRWAADDEALSDLAVAAGAAALRHAGVDPKSIALLILATSTPDHLLPPSAPLVAHRLGLGGAGAIDMAGACAGFLYALTFGHGFAAAQGGHVLVIAGNILSRRINFTERDTAVLFSDAAGAVVLGPTPRAGTGLLGVQLASDGAHYDLIQIPAGGSREPFAENVAVADTKMRMRDGRAVFTRAVEMMAETAKGALAAAGRTVDDVDHWVPHQANARIIGAAQRRLGLAADKTVGSVREYGNSSAGTIPLTLSLNAGRFRPGDTLLLTAVGAGLTGGALVFGL